METCEICGRPTSTIYVVEIEGARMWVCADDAKGKRVIQSIDLRRTKTQEKTVAKQKGKVEEELLENYGGEIRKAREKLGLPLRVLAERINEKESTLVRVEKQKTLPSVKLTKKLEKELGIKLTAKVQEEGGALVLRNESQISLWDAADRKGGRKGE